MQYRSILIALLVLVVTAGVVLRQQLQTPPATVHRLSCATLATGCSTTLNGRTLRFGMVGKIEPMTAFEIWVDAPWAEKIEASFTMQGMDMGFNLYTLKPAADGTRRVRVTLPFCVTGKSDWVMNLNLDDTRLEIPFVTNMS